MTFPFVISAMGLGKACTVLSAAGVGAASSLMAQVLVVAELLFATGMVLFVLGHYVKFFYGAFKEAQQTMEAPSFSPSWPNRIADLPSIAGGPTPPPHLSGCPALSRSLRDFVRALFVCGVWFSEKIHPGGI